MTRLVSGAVMAAGALLAILFLPIAGVRLLAAFVAALAAHEYLAIVHARRVLPGTMAWLLLVGVTSWYMLLAPSPELLWLVLVSAAWVAIEVLFRGLTMEEAAVRFFVPWYIGMPLGLLTAVHAGHGRAATLLLLATVVVSDSAQYYSGRAFGRRPLAPTISPKKTVEGAIGGALAGTSFMVLAGARVVPGANVAWLTVTGVSVVLLGICGDLFESRLKRLAGAKDSSTLIPGHGGVLDRIDALLFAAPGFYLLLKMAA